MRKQFVKTTLSILDKDPKTILLLGDIGVYGFKLGFEKHPKRVYNMGICEQAMTGIAAGLSKSGYTPIIHTIAPFITERNYEQIKISLAYNEAKATIVSAGGSYDYSKLGATHHCPGDVAVLSCIPNLSIMVPGHPDELNFLLSTRYDKQLNYIRLSERSNSVAANIEFGKIYTVKCGSKAVILAVGTMLEKVLKAVFYEDVTILYCTTLIPFDTDPFRICNKPVIIVEPFYEGTTATILNKPLNITNIGIPRQFLKNYCTIEEQDKFCGLTTEQIRERVLQII